MSLLRDLRKLIRTATKALKLHMKARRLPVDAGDGGKGADALGKALGEFQQDPTLAALDTTPPKSYAAYGELPGRRLAPSEHSVKTVTTDPEAPPL